MNRISCRYFYLITKKKKTRKPPSGKQPTDPSSVTSNEPSSATTETSKLKRKKSGRTKLKITGLREVSTSNLDDSLGGQEESTNPDVAFIIQVKKSRSIAADDDATTMVSGTTATTLTPNQYGLSRGNENEVKSIGSLQEEVSSIIFRPDT